MPLSCWHQVSLCNISLKTSVESRNSCMSYFCIMYSKYCTQIFLHGAKICIKKPNGSMGNSITSVLYNLRLQTWQTCDMI